MANKFLLDGDVLKPAISSQDTWAMNRSTDSKSAEAPIEFTVNSRGAFVPKSVGDIREVQRADGTWDLIARSLDRDCYNVETRRRYAIRVVEIII